MTNSSEIGQHMDRPCHCSQPRVPLVGMTKQTRAIAYYTPAMVNRAIRVMMKPTEPKCMLEELEELNAEAASIADSAMATALARATRIDPRLLEPGLPSRTIEQLRLPASGCGGGGWLAS